MRHRGGKVTFNEDLFKNFIILTNLGETVELNHHTVPGYSHRQWFVKVGTKKPREIGIAGEAEMPPRIRNIGSALRQFRATTEKLLLSKEASMFQADLAPSASAMVPCATQEGRNTMEKGNPDTESTEIVDPDPPDTDLVLLRLKHQLLPLLFKEELLQDAYELPWRSDINVNEIEDTLHEIASEIRHRRDDKLSRILGSRRMPLSPNSKVNKKFCATLKSYSIDLEDKDKTDALLRDLYFLNKKRFNSTTIMCEIKPGQVTQLICVPKSKDLECMQRNERRTGWFSSILSAIGGPTEHEVTVKMLLDFIAHSPRYRMAWDEAVVLNGYPLPRLDGITTKAVQFMVGLKNTQMRQLRSVFLAELGCPIFSSNLMIASQLDMEYVVPKTGKLKYGRELIPWCYKSIDKVLCFWLQNRWKRKVSPPLDHIDVVISIDHGKGHSRVTANFIARWKTSDTSWQQDEYNVTIANARCRKDNPEIIENTYGKLLNGDLKKLRSSQGLSILPTGNVALGCVPSRTHYTPIELFMAADILFYSMALGKDGMSTWWCPQCKLFKRDWEEKDHQRGEDWTIDALKLQGAKVVSGLFGNDRRKKLGVKTEPLFDAIPVSHYILPILHLTIGKGNDILDHLVVELQAAAETYSLAYVKAEWEVCHTKPKLSLAKLDLARYNNSHSDYEKSLKRLLASRTARRQLTLDKEALYESELDDIQADRKVLEAEVGRLVKILDAANLTLKGEKKKEENGKAFGQPLNAKMDDILRKHGIDRGHVFGGDIDGNACRRLMENASSIVDDIESYVHGLTTQKCASQEEIHEVCEYHKQLFFCMDGYLSAMRVKRFHLTDRVIVERKQFQEKILKWERYLGMNTTTKSHMIEDHSDQQEKFQGIGDLTEDFGERNHQYEAKADRLLGAVRDYEKRETFKSKDEAMNKDAILKIKAEEIRRKRKREPQQRDSETNAEKRYQQQLENRRLARLFVVPNGFMETLQQKKDKILQAMETINEPTEN